MTIEEIKKQVHKINLEMSKLSEMIRDFEKDDREERLIRIIESKE